jgi:hypothetical protein
MAWPKFEAFLRAERNFGSATFFSWRAAPCGLAAAQILAAAVAAASGLKRGGDAELSESGPVKPSRAACSVVSFYMCRPF